MADCNSCSLNGSCGTDKKASCGIKNNPKNKVKNVIGVLSGKGGVGKSTVSVMLAKELKKKGYKVGIMDADITGPSIPRLLRIEDKHATATKEEIFPVETEDGIKVMSLNLLLKDENQPAIWRGPILAGIVEQFWKDVIWGDLDYLLIDMPPGTGDVALTVMQSIPVSGVVMVSLAQDLVSMIVAKAINMVNQLNIPVLGLVQNMSYVECPDCKKKIKIFESDNMDSFLEENKLELLGELPMNKDIASIAISDEMDSHLEEEFSKIADRVIEKVN